MLSQGPPPKRSRISTGREPRKTFAPGTYDRPIEVFDDPQGDIEVINVVDGSDNEGVLATSDHDGEFGTPLSDFSGGYSNGEQSEEGDFLVDLEFENPTLPVLGQALLDEDIDVARALLADTPLRIQQVANSVEIILPLDGLSELARAVYGINSHEPIRVLVSVHGGYRRTSPLPVVKVEHGEYMTSTERICKDFMIGLQLSKAAQVYLVARWQNRGDGFLAEFAQLLADRLTNAGNRCMMCDQELPFPGLKPTICDESLCSFQLEEMGIGSNLSQFDVDPQVADLLIRVAVAACMDTQRLSVSPISLPSYRGGGDKYKPSELIGLLKEIPNSGNVKDMGESRREILDAISPEIVPVASWLFATNRAHITSVPEKDYFPKMAALQGFTMKQFNIETSTRKHAEKFESLKAAHGSFYAFHGSAFSNWHNILRKNLKNASNTSLMSAGAAYGEGIYMATHTNTSAAYARPAAYWSGYGGSVQTSADVNNDWSKSDLGDAPVCLALVEVANSSRVHKHAGGAIIVASDEDCVMLRYLFVYSRSGAIPQVTATEVVPKRYKNDRTIAYGSTLEEVTATGNLLVTSDDYFWDIEEVVAMVESKNGLFINGYNQLAFAPEDVEAILRHPTGHGGALLELENRNAMLRQHIPRDLLRQLNTAGWQCVSDNTAEFSTATRVIEEVRQRLNSVAPYVKDALAVVPFEAIDSHTRRPFRDTITHALEMVTSGGECVHRFGDFLSQVK